MNSNAIALDVGKAMVNSHSCDLIIMLQVISLTSMITSNHICLSPPKCKLPAGAASL